ncbi:Dihydrodipicolinate reductase [Mycobacterium intracellulare subsp. intracellulare MTCC 9506]|uniref:Dihydrodipicolinate reductase n=1 Tax=Mycobacterium indicus pranii (strain DSM 45239 / MTCC 9506) TaxID=1232724 RepID=J9WA23_MYCIP|nr:Dihydrodipicolinate reductase [Mycobacterium intracellulare subsp. intracellulare MTCC 9506]
MSRHLVPPQVHISRWSKTNGRRGFRVFATRAPGSSGQV